MIAVGTPITGRPPHNAVRATFPHNVWRATYYAANRLVAGELERRWNERLENVRMLEEQLADHDIQQTPALSPQERESLLTLGADLSRAWDSPGAGVETRKKKVRLLIEEIAADVADEKVELIIHWQGGDHTCLSLKKRKSGQNHWAGADVVDLVRSLARQLPDKSIAAVLNRSGKSTGRGNSWTSNRVCSLRHVETSGPRKDHVSAT